MSSIFLRNWIILRNTESNGSCSVQPWLQTGTTIPLINQPEMAQLEVYSFRFLALDPNETYGSSRRQSMRPLSATIPWLLNLAHPSRTPLRNAETIQEPELKLVPTPREQQPNR